MTIRQITIVTLTAVLLSACNSPSNSSTQTASTQTSGGVVEEALREKIREGFAIRGENLKFTDGKLILTKDGNEHGSIAADGTLVIDGKAITLSPSQRELTAKLHSQAMQVSKDAVSIAGDAAGVASTAVSEGVKLAMSSIFKGNDQTREAEFERKIEERVTSRIKPGALKICSSSNQMHESKRQLANAVPEYRKYFEDREPCDVAELEKELTRDAASTSADRPSSTQ